MVMGTQFYRAVTVESGRPGLVSPAGAPTGVDHADIGQFVPGSGASCEFFKAVMDGARDQVEAFMTRDPELINACTRTGSTPLGLAAFFGHLEIVQYLIGQGAPVDGASRNFTRETPLHCSVLRGHVAVAGFLIERGADVNARQVGDFTPLHAAAQNGDVEMLKLLLAHHADVNARHAEGGTALSVALDWGHQDMASLLWQHGGTD
jgi:ankyrin repeat protein